MNCTQRTNNALTVSNEKYSVDEGASLVYGQGSRNPQDISGYISASIANTRGKKYTMHQWCYDHQTADFVQWTVFVHVGKYYFLLFYLVT